MTQTLFADFYSKGFYRDLWFRWEGKPLILADPSRIRPEMLASSQRTPGLLRSTETYGQTFRAERPFDRVGGEFPTYNSVASAATVSLYAGGPRRRLVAKRRLAPLKDNALALWELSTPLPAGDYYLEQSEPGGQVGWWSESGDVYAAGRAMLNGAPAPGDRTLSVRYVGETTPKSLVPRGGALSKETASTLTRRIKAFFTFRTPQADYFTGPTGRDQWGWLEVFPQHVFRNAGGGAEQMVVGVAQNAVDGRLAVLSNPRAHGRSFHKGKQPGPEGQDHSGKNFQEQWDRALQVDPRFVFVTGWNEWIAGRFDASAPFYGTGPVNFVDSFDHEYSRDIEPVKGGHTDSYYYQLVANVRRYKGARPPEAPNGRHEIRIDGRFNDWRKVRPEFRDDRFDTAFRDHPGWGTASHFRNRTGRNDLVRMKVAQGARHAFFFAEAREPWRGVGAGVPLTLWVSRGFRVLGFGRGDGFAVLERNRNGLWIRERLVPCRLQGRSLELSIPLDLMGKSGRFDFKWTDNVDPEANPLDLYRHGDTAPNGRFAYAFRRAP